MVRPPKVFSSVVRFCREKFLWSFPTRKWWCCSEFILAPPHQIPLYLVPLYVFFPIKACSRLFPLLFFVLFDTVVAIDGKKGLRFKVNFILIWGIPHNPSLYVLSFFELLSESIVIERRVHICHLIANSRILFLCFPHPLLHERAHTRWLTSWGWRTLAFEWWFRMI